MKIKKNDTIIISKGKDRGREGKVTRVFLKESRVLVEGINQYKKHIKPTQGRPGDLVTISRPLDISKVALICPKCKQPTRIGYRFQDAKKIRVCRKCNSDIDSIIKTKKKV